MRTILPLLLLAAPCAAQYNTDNLRVSPTASMSREPVLEKLAIFPVLANGAFLSAHATVERTTPMHKAIAANDLVITEKQGGGQVNALVAKNTSQDTIYLMQGEVVSGGKQDRVLAQDVLLAPGGSVEISAFCVEQGRWEAGAEKRSFSKVQGVGAQKLRSAVANKKEQQAVWHNVADYLQEFEVQAPTGTFNALQDDAAFQRDMTRYRAHFNALYKSHPQIIGVVAISGDEVIGCDLFATTAMFQSAYEGLLQAYITEALTRGKPVTAGAPQAQGFLEALLADEEELDKRLQERGSLFRDKDRTLRVSWF